MTAKEKRKKKRQEILSHEILKLFRTHRKTTLIPIRYKYLCSTDTLTASLSLSYIYSAIHFLILVIEDNYWVYWPGNLKIECGVRWKRLPIKRYSCVLNSLVYRQGRRCCYGIASQFEEWHGQCSMESALEISRSILGPELYAPQSLRNGFPVMGWLRW